MATDERLSPGKSLLPDLEFALIERLEDVRVLRIGGRLAAAVTNGIYALEIRLKIALCRRIDLDELPKVFQTHDLVGLLYISGLKKQLDRPEFAVVRSGWFKIVTNTVSYDLNLLRYKPSAISVADTDEFFRLLLDSTVGVLTWVSSMTPSLADESPNP
jgi:hypothetical protein